MDLTAAVISPIDIHIWLSPEYFSPQLTILFFHRLAQLGHLKNFQFTFWNPTDTPKDVIDAFLEAVAANKILKTLTVSDLGHHLKDLLRVLESHDGLRTLKC
ncbi:hypothetical protein FisN_12Hu063 [Fistulifera solaris]|uniref:Uncharacterized protein n=1 Tax=Fistulifera solaris TaxID=1519565 RepID=A0A1Z5K2G5_FISSO|nr:hypothetical protein FisN_12Hu063 [Fistulifera solaris]|eukprot:GAX20218.1 hypothetical protein FisN_12Hu063 [Fistulifera solaris]